MPAERPVALVTGASSGIGLALAELLAAQGHDLIVVARRRQRLEALAARLGAQTGATVEILVADLTAADELSLVEERVAAQDRLDLLVNNAGFPGYAPLADLDLATVERLIRVHVMAPARLSRAALPGMLARRRGALVNVASLLALSGPLHIGMNARATYAGAKSFLLTFTQSLAMELKDSGVRAMVCLPGMVESEFHGEHWRAPAGLPLMSSEDVARAIVAGLAREEVVCVPGLEDIDVFARLAELQQAAMRGGQQVELAQRYRET
jgi:short-subunit dehydrogenase